jgi:hypothetical protein
VIVLSRERRYRVVEAPAVAVPVLAVVSVTEKLPPAAAEAGGFDKALTTRSGVPPPVGVPVKFTPVTLAPLTVTFWLVGVKT